MKKIMYVSLAIFVIFISFSSTTISFASFEIEYSVEKNEREKYIDDFEIEYFDSPQDVTAFCCFDVSDNCMVALGSSKMNGYKSVQVYSEKMEFCYGYRFKTSGDFLVCWEGEFLCLYIVRGDLLIRLDSVGGVVDIHKCNYALNRSYINLLYSGKRTIGDKVYVLDNNFGFFNFFSSGKSRLIMETEGSRVVLVDNSAEHLTKAISAFCVVITLALSITIFLFITVRKELKRMKSS